MPARPNRSYEANLRLFDQACQMASSPFGPCAADPHPARKAESSGGYPLHPRLPALFDGPVGRGSLRWRREPGAGEVFAASPAIHGDAGAGERR